MLHKYDYGTVSEAIRAFREAGYEMDFKLESDYLLCDEKVCMLDDFEIASVYRYEGNSDPADEATVYAIESKDGLLKGILVTGYGTYTDGVSAKMLRKLALKED